MLFWLIFNDSGSFGDLLLIATAISFGRSCRQLPAFDQLENKNLRFRESSLENNMNSEHKNRELRKAKNVKRDWSGNLVSFVSRHGELVIKVKVKNVKKDWSGNLVNFVSRHGELVINVKVKSESEKCENGFEWKSC